MAVLWKVFLPSRMLSSPPGYIVGKIHSHMHVVCVTGCQETILDTELEIKVLGYWNGKTNLRRHPSRTPELEGNPLINVLISGTGQVECTLYQNEDCHPVSIVIYSPEDLLQSYLLKSHNGYSQNGVNILSSNANVVIQTLNVHQRTMADIKEFDHGCSFISKTKQSIIEKCTTSAMRCILKIINLLTFILGFRFIDGGVLHQILDIPAVFHQLSLRYQQVKLVLDDKHSEPIQKLRFGNISTRQVIDSLLGVAVLVILTRPNTTQAIADATMAWGESVAAELSTLLSWLMGAPAGLKLNRPLNEFLGRFFHHHIYLWTGYLAVLKPFLSTLLWYSSLLGVLGLSVQLCLLQDILSMMTLHIYCFYVYAARLFSLQLSGLSSLWRLFRGKKWNVLRRRVDSAPYDVDQLFIGTLLFTVMLFLLPTTLLYYVVFTMLRVLVLILQGSLSRLVAVINSLPIYAILLWLLQSKSITGNVKFHLSTDESTSSTCLYMQTCHTSFSKLLHLTKEESNVSSLRSEYSWSTVLGRIIRGQLIYPWIETSSRSDHEIE